MPELLPGKRALVLGGAGEVGEGIVRQMLTQGARVAVPSRSPERLKLLRRRLAAGDHLVTLAADVLDADGWARVRGEVRERLGPPAVVVASLGGWWEGAPLAEVEPRTWERLIASSLHAHFLAARTFLPDLAGRAGSSYTLINGAAALQPVPGSGPVSVSAAAQAMLARVLAAEHAEDPVRINSLLLATPILTRSRSEGPDEWLSADDVGRYVAYLTSREGAAVRGEQIVFRQREDLPAIVAGD